MTPFAKPRTRARIDDERVLPLINVVFLLLIFFMLAGQLATPDPFRVEPPESASERLVDAQELVLLIAADGRIAVDGEEVRLDGLTARAAAAVKQMPGLKVRLRADAASDAAQIVRILEALRAANVETVHLLTVGRE
jgi:biopolymer transport protein ExbD